MTGFIVLDRAAYTSFLAALDRPPRRIPSLIRAMDAAGFAVTWPLYDSEGCYLERES